MIDQMKKEKEAPHNFFKPLNFIWTFNNKMRGVLKIKVGGNEEN